MKILVIHIPGNYLQLPDENISDMQEVIFIFLLKTPLYIKNVKHFKAL